MDPLRRIPLKQKLVLARKLRREATPAENRAWALLRNRQVLGLKFRRQHVLHGFIVDFYCAAHRLVVELDGSVHDEPWRKQYDAARTACLIAAGYQVVRIRNRELNRNRLESLIRDASRLGLIP